MRAKFTWPFQLFFKFEELKIGFSLRPPPLSTAPYEHGVQLVRETPPSNGLGLARYHSDICPAVS